LHVHSTSEYDFHKLQDDFLDVGSQRIVEKSTAGHLFHYRKMKLKRMKWQHKFLVLCLYLILPSQTVKALSLKLFSHSLRLASKLFISSILGLVLLVVHLV